MIWLDQEIVRNSTPEYIQSPNVKDIFFGGRTFVHRALFSIGLFQALIFLPYFTEAYGLFGAIYGL